MRKYKGRVSEYSFSEMTSLCQQQYNNLDWTFDIAQVIYYIFIYILMFVVIGDILNMIEFC